MRASGKRQQERERQEAGAPRPLPGRLFVAELKLTDFRNYASAKLGLDPRPVVLVGDNGAGKTNLLEAVSLLGAGHGLRGRPYGELCRKEGSGGFAVAARVASRHGEVEIGTGLAGGSGMEGAGRTVRIGGKDAGAGALAEHVKLVWLIPAMDGLFTGPAAERRRFLDRLVLAIDPKMRTPLGRYEGPCGSETACFRCGSMPAPCSRGWRSRWPRLAWPSPRPGSTRCTGSAA